MRHSARRSWSHRAGVTGAAVAVLVLLWGFSPATAVAYQSIATFEVTASPVPPAVDEKLRKMETEALGEVNDERRDAGLPPLAMSPDLCAVARAYSRDMAERRFFDHQDPDGLRVDGRTARAGISWRFIGENIARNRGFHDPADVAVREWMKSAGHRDNILNDRYVETGIGAWIASDKTVYFTQIFIERG